AKLAQAEADWTAVSSLTQTLAPVFIALGTALIICLPLKAAFEQKNSSPSSYLSKTPASPAPPSQPSSGNASPLLSAEQQALDAQRLFKQGVGNTKAGKYSDAI